MRIQRGFIYFKDTNIIIRLSQIVPSARYLLCNSLNHTWGAIDELVHVPLDDKWRILAVYDNCYSARIAVISIFQKLKSAFDMGDMIYCQLPPAGDSEFCEIEQCKGCEHKKDCKKSYKEMHNAWPDAIDKTVLENFNRSESD